jgi:hypothetical protein
VATATRLESAPQRDVASLPRAFVYELCDLPPGVTINEYRCRRGTVRRGRREPLDPFHEPRDVVVGAEPGVATGSDRLRQVREAEARTGGRAHPRQGPGGRA